ncbi:MAG TPA: class I SAM-dependent methyltransferase [Thermoanaerobaculia bacterium]|nr:class I SAM-dependent methyltransferase [Thermoanaerobaculia bacterium]
MSSEPARHRCRFCDAPLSRVFVDLGVSPLANSYLEPEDLDRPETFYPLKAYLCEECLLVQLPEAARPEEIFTDYAYFSSYSASWVEHARRYAEMASARFGLAAESLVVEVASNDGYLLRHFRKRGVPVLGIEPAANVARAAEAAGIPTRNEFLTLETARALAAEGVRADLLVGNNVLAHVPALNDFVAALAALLAPEGVATLELPHLLRLMAEHQFDTIYHEHFSYFSFHTVRRVLGAHGLAVFDVEELPTHGGSLRVYARHAGAADPPPRSFAFAQDDSAERVADLLAREREAGLLEPATYDAFEERVRATKRGLLHFLLEARERGERVAGYGAPAKGNTLLNYCGVGPDLLAFTVDRSPHKQGRYLPGTRIPIAAPDRLREERPDYVLILPWNLTDEIVEQMADVRSWGGRFVVAIPEVRIF